MKKFPFKYSPLAVLLIVIIAVIFAAAFILNVAEALFRAETVISIILHIFVAMVCFLVVLCAVAALVYGRYVIKGKYLYCRFGFLFVKTEIKSIFQITEFKVQNKLVMYFTDQKYSVAVISDKYYQEFYKALKTVNPSIVYTVQASDEE